MYIWNGEAHLRTATGAWRPLCEVDMSCSSLRVGEADAAALEEAAVAARATHTDQCTPRAVRLPLYYVVFPSAALY